MVTWVLSFPAKLLRTQRLPKVKGPTVAIGVDRLPGLAGVTVTGPTRTSFELGTNADESIPSSLSAFRFVTLVPELTVKGGWPLATLRPSAVAPVPVLVLVTCNPLPATGAVSEVVELAELGLP